MPELELFEKLLIWAGKECERRKLEANKPNMRKVLQPILPYIRFPTMTMEDVTLQVAPTELLSKDQLLALYVWIGSKPYDNIHHHDPSSSCCVVSLYMIYITRNIVNRDCRSPFQRNPVHMVVVYGDWILYVHHHPSHYHKVTCTRSRWRQVTDISWARKNSHAVDTAGECTSIDWWEHSGCSWVLWRRNGAIRYTTRPFVVLLVMWCDSLIGWCLIGWYSWKICHLQTQRCMDFRRRIKSIMVWRHHDHQSAIIDEW